MGVNMCRISDMRDMMTVGLRHKASLSTVQHLSRVETFNTVLISNLLDVLTLDIFGIIDILKMICTWEREEE